MIGTLIADDKGYVIETLYTMDDEPTMLISRYRVTVMDGRPRSEKEPVRYSNQIWVGSGFQCGTDNVPPESMDKVAIKKPRGKKVWRGGEWRKA